MSKGSMRGKAPKAGKGVGRKRGEGSTTVRVPNGCLEAVQQLIADYKEGKPVNVVSDVVSDLDQVDIPLNSSNHSE